MEAPTPLPLRKAYLALKYHPDGRNRPLIEALSACLEKHGWKTYCVLRDLEHWGEVTFDPPELMRLSLAAIDTSDLVIAELSEKGVGIGIEAGYAYARQIPILTLARHGADISDTLRGISRQVLVYGDLTEVDAFLDSVGTTLRTSTLRPAYARLDPK
jgi:2'-deoxynucleoside 5'-phosphate N-hydrolase